MAKLAVSETPHDIWVVAELADGALTPLTLELTYGARMAADMMGFYVKVAVLGNDLRNVSDELIKAGADRVYLLDHPALSATGASAAGAASHLKALSDLFVAQAPEFVLFGATPLGEALASRMAQRFGGGLIARCMALRVDDFERAFVGQRAVYGGEYYEVVASRGPAPQFATVLPDCFGPPYVDATRLGETERVAVEVGDHGPRSAAKWGWKLEEAEAVQFEMPRPQLKRAKRIVSVGRQVGDVEAARQLACVLGAEFAGAREALDEGYIDESQVVGITGARVAPDLYLALGIRGDTQHLFGMQDARFVVAVHPDPDAPIFKQADAGIVGDPAQVASELRRVLIGS
ncbi:MAG TPA: electron transfer flavoprotein subunit alpha/FixB family protein [Anaerolineae bacterium]|nr:electron transfer flavoprotein subunit alpha/FixB family protein [Anaerolineae bacterium]